MTQPYVSLSMKCNDFAIGHVQKYRNVKPEASKIGTVDDQINVEINSNF